MKINEQSLYCAHIKSSQLWEHSVLCSHFFVICLIYATSKMAIPQFLPSQGQEFSQDTQSIFSMTVLWSKVKLHSQEKNENKWSENQEQPCSEGRVGFLNSGSHPSLCPMSFDWQSINSFRLGYTTFPLLGRHLPISTQLKPMVVGGGRSKKINANLL